MYATYVSDGTYISRSEYGIEEYYNSDGKKDEYLEIVVGYLVNNYGARDLNNH